MLTKDTKVNHYDIIEKIGEGGMGEVYLAHDSKLDREVALKFLSDELGQNEQFRKRFTREAQTAAKLNHPNIVTVHEVGEFENRQFISMTYVKGQPLDKYAPDRKLSFSEIIQIGVQIAEGLTSAHSQGITHRDLKPANIIIDENEKVHILDFGLAIFNWEGDNKNLEKTLTKLTDVGTVMGTVPYMAPEQLRGQPVDHLADIFSLGVILHELTCGSRPFSGSAAAEISSSILRDQPKPVSEIRTDAPYDLQRIIGRCLQKDPGKRFQTAKDVKNELEELRLGDSAKRLAVDIKVGPTTKSETVTEGSFILTADLVRKLEHRSPKMIGGKLSYAVNNVRTETLLVVMHSLALEHRSYTPIIDKIPCTCVVPTLFGWESGAIYRPALSISDHSKILKDFIKYCVTQHQAKRLIFAGFASGSEQIIDMLTSTDETGLKVNGVLLLRCNIDLSSLFVSSIFSQMDPGNEASILSSLTKVSARLTSLQDWARHQSYLMAMIQRFGADIEPVKRYSADIVRPFQANELETFPNRYKSIVSKVPVVRFVFDRDEFAALDRVLQRHLEDNILGDSYSEKTIMRADMSHFQLGRPESLLEQALSFLKEFDQQLGLSPR